MSAERIYPAKLLLFGEYSVICDSKALAIPLQRFRAHWHHEEKTAQSYLDQQADFNSFLTYLKEKQENHALPFDLDLIRMEADLNDGWMFQSDIPMGYGVGSSGALVAGVFDRFGPGTMHGHDNESLLKLKKQFSGMESYFHGVSSGLDPLLCYTNKALLIQGKETIFPVDTPDPDQWPLGIYLVDTKMTGKTGPLVDRFFDQCRQRSFYRQFTETLIPANNQCIDSLLAGEWNDFSRALRHLSEFFFEYFKPMIPEHVRSLWKEGLESESYTFKLCGSGGGGFLLAFAQNTAAFEKKMLHNSINAFRL